MQTIKVKYIGKGDAIVSEWDGVKYTFSKSDPVQIIPLKVFQDMQNSFNVFRDDVIPFQEDSKEKENKVKVEESTPIIEEVKNKRRTRRIKNEQ